MRLYNASGVKLVHENPSRPLYSVGDLDNYSVELIRRFYWLDFLLFNYSLDPTVKRSSMDETITSNAIPSAEHARGHARSVIAWLCSMWPDRNQTRGMKLECDE